MKTSSSPKDTEPLQIPAPIRAELVHLADAVCIKRLEHENAQLRQELAVRRLVDSLGLSGENIAIDLDEGVVRIRPSSQADRRLTTVATEEG